MQLGGNHNASRFFSEHGVGERVEAKAKYSSRAAVLYREKLQSLADKAMAQYGTSVLHLDKTGAAAAVEEEQSQKSPQDFFDSHVNKAASSGRATGYPQMSQPSHFSYENQPPVTAAQTIPTVTQTAKTQVPADAGGAPNVDLALSTSPSSFVPAVDPIKLAPKPATGLAGNRRKPGGKLGAQKIKITNFADLESKASEQEKFNASNSAVSKDPLTAEEEKRQMDEISKNVEKVSLQRERIRQTDPNKADQMERLGLMGGGSNRTNNRQQSAASTAKSHSALSDMVVIDQARASNGNSNNNNSSLSSFSSWNTSSGLGGGGGGFRESRNEVDEDDFFGSGSSKRRADQDQFFDAISDEPLKPMDTRATSYGGGSHWEQKSTNSRNGYGGGGVSNGSSSSVSGGDSFSNKFSNAKSISSNQYFGREPADDFGSIDHSKYTGASSISSRDLFGGPGANDGVSSRYTYGGGYGGGGYSGPDVEQMKDDLKHGISSLAGRLSKATASVMDTIQDRYA